MLDLIEIYGAQTLHARGLHGDERVEGAGGGLLTALYHVGLGPLTARLGARPSLRSLELHDADAGLTLRREGANARVTMRWATGESLEDVVELAPSADALSEGGLPLFVPDPTSRVSDVFAALSATSRPLYVVEDADGQALYTAGRYGGGPGAARLLGALPPAPALGSEAFCARMGVRAPYIAGAMAGGIASPELVIAMSKAGLIGFFGAGGLPIEAVRAGVKTILDAVGAAPAGFNLLHNPAEPAAEEAVADLYVEAGVRWVSASAYMGLTPAVVRYRYAGIRRGPDGGVICPNRVLAKVSRPEVAEHFMRPAPGELLQALVKRGKLSPEEAELAVGWPMADAITAEADSGGHTDRRPLPVLVPMMRSLRDRVSASLHYAARGAQIFIGAAGGVASPRSVLAAFALGADYVLTGSVNQSAREAGTSAEVKELLAEAGMADVAMGPAPDMFEIGAQVQVLSRGTLYAQRAKKLHELYKDYAGWPLVPEADRQRVERQILGRGFDEVWADCQAYWGARDPSQVERAQTDGRHKMALVFRWYLGMTSRWARSGETARRRDYQVWCGPAMGAFNDWAKGSALGPLSGRGVVEIADALLTGARILSRGEALRAQGVSLPVDLDAWRP